MLGTFADTRLVEAALEKAQAERATMRPKLEKQRAAVASEITRTEQAVKRYQVAFETGTLSAAAMAPRIRELTEQLDGLQGAAEELDTKIAEDSIPRVTQDLLAEIRSRMGEVHKLGSPTERKAMLKEVVVELRVKRTTIYPTYKLPRSTVLMPGGLGDPVSTNSVSFRLVDPRGFEPLTF